MDTERFLTKARSNLVMTSPFFGSLALRLKFKEDASVEETVCDGSYIRYNPKVIDKMTLEELTGHLAHLVFGPALLHHTRRGDRDKKKWNMASDYAINPILTEAGFQLPSNKYNSPQYKDKTVEQIYAELPDEPKNDNPPDQPGDKPCDQPGEGDKNKGKKPGKSPPGDGGVEDSPSQTQSEKDQDESEWKIALAQALHAAKEQGKVPASLERLVEDMLEPEHPWRQILQRFITERVPTDTNWRRGNRRFIYNDLYLPGRDSDVIGEVVVAVDVSGSISEKEVNEFAAEISSIFDDVTPSKLHVIYCSSRIHKVDTFTPSDDFHITPEGCGGTDFRPPFKWVEENEIEPKCFIYLTDGYGPFPEEDDAPYPVLWCINNDQVTPPFGEHLTLTV
jgi:predicted metal-dependent peptidase